MTRDSNDDEARVDDAWRTQQEIEGADLSGDRGAAMTS